MSTPRLGGFLKGLPSCGVGSGGPKKGFGRARGGMVVPYHQSCHSCGHRHCQLNCVCSRFSWGICPDGFAQSYQSNTPSWLEGLSNALPLDDCPPRNPPNHILGVMKIRSRFLVAAAALVLRMHTGVGPMIVRRRLGWRADHPEHTDIALSQAAHRDQGTLKIHLTRAKADMTQTNGSGIPVLRCGHFERGAGPLPITQQGAGREVVNGHVAIQGAWRWMGELSVCTNQPEGGRVVQGGLARMRKGSGLEQAMVPAVAAILIGMGGFTASWLKRIHALLNPSCCLIGGSGGAGDTDYNSGAPPLRNPAAVAGRRAIRCLPGTV